MRTLHHSLHVATPLAHFIDNEVLPGTGIGSEHFWAGFDALVRDLRPLEAQHPDLVTPDSPTHTVRGAAAEQFAPVQHRQRPGRQAARAPVDDLLVFHVVFGKTVPDISLNAVANLGYADCRFLAPVFVGDTLAARSTVIDSYTRERITAPARTRSPKL